jgi:hypothetical protein
MNLPAQDYSNLLICCRCAQDERHVTILPPPDFAARCSIIPIFVTGIPLNAPCKPGGEELKSPWSRGIVEQMQAERYEYWPHWVKQRH